MRKRIKPKRAKVKLPKWDPTKPKTPLTLEAILSESPDIPGYGGGQWAMYAVGCIWWTSFPEDLGKFEGLNIPVCPHCRSPLFQAPLKKFVAAAQEHPDHYGKGGLDTFAQAHSRNLGAEKCFPSWKAISAHMEAEGGARP